MLPRLEGGGSYDTCVRSVCDVWNLRMDLDNAKYSQLALFCSGCLFYFPCCGAKLEKVAYSLALVPLKSASRVSISSSEPSAFSMTRRPPDLLEGTKEVSFPRLWVVRKHISLAKKSSRLG